jgi:hypothetical protein
MTDLELLVLAAKAAGYQIIEFDDDNEIILSNHFGINEYLWNPINDDADAFRLITTLNIVVGKYNDYANAISINSDADVVVWDHQVKDPYAATRRAIVQVAAEIGKGM